MYQVSRFSFFLFIAALAFSGCQTSKQLPYFTDLPKESVSRLNTYPYEPLKLQMNDELQVTISSTSPEAAQFFNLTAVSPSVNANASLTGAPQGYINLYRVNSAGTITMPVLGEVPAAGLTSEELKQVIAQKLKDYLKDAVVTVTLVNFKVTVIGEVNRPVVVPVNGQTINVLEAIGASGDMTVFGIRKNVRVLRKMPDGKTEVAVLDFNKSRVLSSPYFQLRQNDIVYVEPSKSKGILGTRTGVWVPIITSIISVTTVILTRTR